MSVYRLSIVVKGRVQGVGFRFFTSNHARKHKLTGWVRNSMDGSVEMEVQGEDEKLNLFREEVRSGPILSRVTDLTVTELPVMSNETQFDVRH